MRTRLSILTAAVLAASCFVLPEAALAQAQAALAGQVSSAKEGAMEGVVVSAKRAGGRPSPSASSPMTTGHYSFPASRLEPGHYVLTIRAVGYELDGAKARRSRRRQGHDRRYQVAPTKTAALPAHQCRMARSMPGTDQQKKFPLGCIGCHVSTASSDRSTAPTSSCSCSTAWLAIIRAARRNPQRLAAMRARHMAQVPNCRRGRPNWLCLGQPQASTRPGPIR